MDWSLDFPAYSSEWYRYIDDYYMIMGALELFTISEFWLKLSVASATLQLFMISELVARFISNFYDFRIFGNPFQSGLVHSGSKREMEPLSDH